MSSTGLRDNLPMRCLHGISVNHKRFTFVWTGALLGLIFTYPRVRVVPVSMETMYSTYIKFGHVLESIGFGLSKRTWISDKKSRRNVFSSEECSLGEIWNLGLILLVSSKSQY